MYTMFKILASLAAMFVISNGSALAEEVLELKPEGLVVLRGEITSINITKAIYDIEKSPHAEVLLFINSPGGSVFAGSALVKHLESTSKKVTCVGQVAISMGFAIFQACAKRVVMSDSILMQHKASFGLPEGPAENQASFVAFIMDSLSELNRKQANRVGLSYEAFIAKISNDWWTLGKDAVRTHLADSLANVKCSPAMYQTELTEVITLPVGQINLTWSSCPLIPYPLRVSSSAPTADTAKVLDKILSRPSAR